MDFKQNILSESNRLSLYLTLKKAYRQGGYSGMSKEYEDLFAYNLLNDKKNLSQLQKLVSKQTFLYPRLHSCLTLLVQLEISQSEGTTKDKARLCSLLIKGLLEDNVFNEDVYGEMKSTSKFKFLHIGLSLWVLLVKEVQVWDSKCKQRETLVDAFLGPNFIRVLVKNVSNTKAQLHD